jgi:hypothetical protein
MIRSPRAVVVITFRSQTAMHHPEEPDPAHLPEPESEESTRAPRSVAT